MKPKNVKSKIVLIIIIILLLILTGLAVYFSFFREEAYRTIKIDSITGKAEVYRTKQSELLEAYEGMQLISGDEVTVKSDSTLSLVVDSDKYLFAESGTRFSLDTDGTEESSKTIINLEKGSVLTRIANKLSADSEYEIRTPNSVMSVRGTVFLISIKEDEKGEFITELSVYHGAVEVTLPADENDEEKIQQVKVNAGDAVVVLGEEQSEFQVDPITNQICHPIDEDTIPESVLNQLVSYVEDGQEINLPSFEKKETSTPEPTQEVIVTPTNESTATVTPTPTNVPTVTVRPTPTNVPTVTVTPTPTNVPTVTPTPTPQSGSVNGVIVSEIPESLTGTYRSNPLFGSEFMVERRSVSVEIFGEVIDVSMDDGFIVEQFTYEEGVTAEYRITSTYLTDVILITFNGTAGNWSGATLTYIPFGIEESAIQIYFTKEQSYSENQQDSQDDREEQEDKQEHGHRFRNED